jgi:hypothetical protein
MGKKINRFYPMWLHRKKAFFVILELYYPMFTLYAAFQPWNSSVLN